MSEPRRAYRLLASYPTVKHAVAWVELMLCVPPEGEEESAWVMMVRCGLTLDEIREEIKTCLRDAIAEGDDGKNEEALAECDFSEFTRYLAGKLGMV